MKADKEAERDRETERQCVGMKGGREKKTKKGLHKAFGKSHQVELDAKMFDIHLFCVTSVGQTTERLFVYFFFDK